MLVRNRVLFGLVLAVVLAGGAALRAATVTLNGITLTYPGYPLSGPALLSCEPGEDSRANTITVSGVPAGSTITVMFAWSVPFSGVPNFLAPTSYTSDGTPLVVPVVYPFASDQWPLWNQTTNERAIQIASFVEVNIGGVKTKLNKTWWIRCLPPPKPADGCTPGYWRQEQHFDSWVGYAPGDDFETVFGVDASFNPHTLLDAVWLGGGGEFALARHAVAALLNASAGLNYTYTLGQVIAGVQNAYATGDFETFKNQLDLANNAGCPLN